MFPCRQNNLYHCTILSYTQNVFLFVNVPLHSNILLFSWHQRSQAHDMNNNTSNTTRGSYIMGDVLVERSDESTPAKKDFILPVLIVLLNLKDQMLELVVSPYININIHQHFLHQI